MNSAINSTSEKLSLLACVSFPTDLMEARRDHGGLFFYFLTVMVIVLSVLPIFATIEYLPGFLNDSAGIV